MVAVNTDLLTLRDGAGLDAATLDTLHFGFAATVIDGYAMTKNGEAGRALGAVLFSSLVGALIGAAVLALSVPVIRPIVLAFGPPEFLMLTVLGLSFIVSLAGQHMIKGFIMAAFGFLLEFIQQSHGGNSARGAGHGNARRRRWQASAGFRQGVFPAA